MRALRIVSVSASWLGVFAKEDLIFVIGVLVTILNLYLEYLSRKKEKVILEEPGSSSS